MADAATRVDDPQSRGRRVAGGEAPTRRCPMCGAQYPLDFKVCPKDATSLDMPASSGEDPLIGEVLAGSFCITGVLGSGGMGRVYEAEHVRLPRRFAVKIMHEQLASYPEAVARFEREAQAVARVVSENVFDVVDVVRAKDGRPCIVSELLEGEELGDLLDRQGKLPLITGIAIARQVCRGLAAAHAVGVVHRDLKPSNLFVQKRDNGGLNVKILDFGVAKVTDGAALTHTGMVVGTPAYMAPEQARGSSNVDARVDIYAVGALLYRMLTGAPPFPEEDAAHTLTRLLTEDPPRPRDIDRSIPEGVEALIQRAMARAPEDRPATVQDLDRLLSSFDEPGRAEGRPPLPTVPRAEALGTMDTLAVALDAPARDAEDVTRRARRARPAALVLAIAVSVFGGAAGAPPPAPRPPPRAGRPPRPPPAGGGGPPPGARGRPSGGRGCGGAAGLTTAATAIRTLSGRTALTDTESVLIAVLAAVATLLTLLGSMRVLVARWRSGPAVQRLGEGLRAALLWLLVGVGALGLVWRGFTSLAPVPVAAQALPVELGLVLLPTLLGAVLLTLGLRRASKIS